jgi:hypothetical protein
MALRIWRSDEGVSRANADPHYHSANGMFGGWTTAVALQAVIDSADNNAKPSAVTINFVERN